jgi:hypothetical protein
MDDALLYAIVNGKIVNGGRTHSVNLTTHS